MSMFLITFLVFGLVVAGMAVGVIMGRGPIKGSCGGMGALGIDTACDICGGDPNAVMRKLEMVKWVVAIPSCITRR